MTKKLRLLLDSRPLFKWHRIDSVARVDQDAFVLLLAGFNTCDAALNAWLGERNIFRLSPNPDEESTHEIPSNIFRVPGALGEMRVGISFCKHCWRDSRASPTLNYQPAWAESG